MSDKTSVQTGWVIIATEGATVDGRAITKTWIEEMAASYSVNEYGALIWPEHFRSSWAPYEGKNWGTVDEVKAAKKGGKLRLFAKLTANKYLLEANKDGQKLYTSIEVNPNFQAEGKAYLQGLAVTDSPASTGTTRLKFSMGSNEIEHDYSELETLNREDFIFANNSPKNTKEDQAKSLLSQLINLFSTTPKKAEVETNIAEESIMTPEQEAALMTKFSDLSEKINGIESSVTAVQSKVEAFTATPATAAAATAEPEPEAPVEPAITAEQFNALTAQLNDMKTKFTEMSKEVAGQEPAPSGGEEQVSLV